MKGRNDQSLSTAGSVPSSTPNQLSISGPLRELVFALQDESHHLPGMMKADNADHRLKATCGRHIAAFLRVSRKECKWSMVADDWVATFLVVTTETQISSSLDILAMTPHYAGKRQDFCPTKSRRPKGSRRSAWSARCPGRLRVTLTTYVPSSCGVGVRKSCG